MRLLALVVTYSCVCGCRVRLLCQLGALLGAPYTYLYFHFVSTNCWVHVRMPTLYVIFYS